MAAVYTPPELPTYLSNTFTLKPVIGVPTDEEVKLIHSVIRAVENASHVPALFNPALSADLAHHLFEVQMARYKSKYTFPIFSDITYTPPEVPSHMNILLEPVVIAPSDDQIRSAQAAFRFAEGMASVPSMYDADLSMQLSQHLFDLQLARYIRRTNEAHYATRDATARADPKENPVAQRLRVPAEPILDIELTDIPDTGRRNLVAGPEGEAHHDPQALHQDSPNEPPASTIWLTGVNGLVDQLKANQDQTNLRLDAMQDRLKDGLEQGFGGAVDRVTGMMIKLHNHSAQGFNSGGDYAYHHIVDKDGEAPTTRTIPHTQWGAGYQFWDVPDAHLAEYLRYYNIGTELVEPGDTPTLMPNSRDQARKILGRFTHSREI